MVNTECQGNSVTYGYTTCQLLRTSSMPVTAKCNFPKTSIQGARKISAIDIGHPEDDVRLLARMLARV